MVSLVYREQGKTYLTGLGSFVSCCVIFFTLLCLRGTAFIGLSSQGILSDPDSYTLVNMLMSWHDDAPFGVMFRVLEPGGSQLHWGYAYPLSVAFLGWCLRHLWVMRVDQSYIFAGLIIGNIAFVVTVWALLWGCLDRSVRLQKSVFWGFVFLLCFGSFQWKAYSGFSTVTHHMPMAMMVSLGFMGFFRSWPMFVLSFCAVFGIWISPEVFPFFLMIFALLLVRDRTEAFMYAFWSLLGTFVVLGCDPVPLRYGDWMPDRISFSYVMLWVWCCFAAFVSRLRFMNPPFYALLFSAVCLILWVMTTGQMRYGIHALLPPDVIEDWYSRVTEILPLSLTMMNCLFLAVSFFFTVFSACIFCQKQFFLQYKSFWYSSSFWQNFVLWVSVLFTWCLSWAHVRSLVFLSVMTALLAARALSRVRAPLLSLPVFRCVFFSIIGIAGLFLMSSRLSVTSFIEGSGVAQVPVHVSHDLASLDAPVFVPLDEQALILYFSRYDHFPVTVGPYHRDVKGMQFYYQVMHDRSDGYRHAYDLLKEAGFGGFVLNKVMVLSELNYSLNPSPLVSWPITVRTQEGYALANQVAQKLNAVPHKMSFSEFLATGHSVPFLKFVEEKENLSVYKIVDP